MCVVLQAVGFRKCRLQHRGASLWTALCLSHPELTFCFCRSQLVIEFALFLYILDLVVKSGNYACTLTAQTWHLLVLGYILTNAGPYLRCVWDRATWAFNNFKLQTRKGFSMSRILAAQLSVWPCSGTGNLSGAEGPAGVLVHLAATPSYTNTHTARQTDL